MHVSEVLDHAPAARRSVLGQHTDDPQQALAAVVAERGHVDLAHIAWMLQTDEAEARRRLGRSVFTDPLTGELLHGADYLSGDVRSKLEIARQAARRDPAFETNVAELERVQPRELLPGQFAIRLGGAWIPDDMVQSFFREYLGDAHLTIQHSGGGNWHIRKGRGLAEEDEVRHSAGGLSPLALVSKALNGGSMTGRPADDEEAARAVRVKIDEWRDAFEAWVLDDSMRAARAAEVYNRQMNSRAVRDFTGARPSLVGLDPDFTPFDHQLAAAARMAHERCLVLAHEVGAGKTATMAIGIMAMKNTGQIDKPLVTVPNGLVEQWEKEVRRLFPTARIITLTSADLENGKRDRVLEYVRANSFDVIIMSHSLFDTIPLSPEFYEFYKDEELRRLNDQIVHERKREGKSVSLKQLEERKKQYEEELKSRAAAVRTPGQVYLDDLGDFFGVDEWHEYKNLAVRSKIPGARVEGSGKAQHLHAVLEWARINKPKGPIGVLTTGTPLTNAIGELHTLVRMANPELLNDIGAEEFDAWAAMYGRMVARLEMSTDGKAFKSVERFASFHNVPSLVRQLWHPVVDFKSAEDLGLERPRIKGGEPELMLVPATADQLQRMEELGERYEAFHQGGVDKSVDNPLYINNDARVIALDPRLVDPEAEPGNKLTALADRIIATWERTRDNRYTYSTKDRRPHPVPGGLIGVFLNNGTPGSKNRGGFDAYQELKNLLIERGMPAEKIAFIQDAGRADQRRKFLDKANHGGINVAIGSTKKMGKGLNAQNRMVALFHVDPDWRPADMAQRDGRIVRHGNQNPEVEIAWVATENTFDSRMYGLLATKAKGFNQLYKARLDTLTDEILEVDDASLPYEEAMAIISGNPYLIAQEELRRELRTLELDQRGRATQRAIVHQKVHQLHQDIERLTRDITRRARVLPALEPVLGDDFRITLDGIAYTKHKDAARPLMQALTQVGQRLTEGRRPTTPDVVLGRLGGLELVAVGYRDDAGEPHVRLHLEGLPGSLQRSTLAELPDLKGETVLRRLVKTLTDAPERQEEDEGNLTAKRATRDELLVYAEQLRGQVPGLGRARERLSLVDALVTAQATVNKAGEPADNEPAAVTDTRRQAIARRDQLQQQLDAFDAAPPAPQVSPEAGAVLLDMDDVGPRRDPATLSASERESEAAILRAHVTVHGDPDGRVAARLTELDETSELPAAAEPSTQEMPSTGTVGELAEAQSEQDSQPPADPAATTSSPAQPSAPEPTSSQTQPPADQATAAEGAAADDDPYGTADLFAEFGLTLPERVPAPAPQEEPEEEEEPPGVAEGQMTVEEVQPTISAAASASPTGQAEERGGEPDDTHERFVSTDGKLTFTLPRIPTDDLHPEAVEGWQRRRDELAAALESKNEQALQSPEQRAQELAMWRRSYKTENRLEPFKPLPALRLAKRADAPGLTPQEYAIGSWVSWRDERTGQTVTGQVMSPGANKDTWYVSTDRTGVTGEYHVLSRSGTKKQGYTYSLSGAAAELRPGGSPPEQVPFEALPAVDAIAARPVASYADYVPTNGLAPVREPISVAVGEPVVRLPELVFDVVADGIPFVVKMDRHDESATELFEPRVEVDGEVVVRLGQEETRAAAVDACVRAARQARELAGKQLYGRSRMHDLDLAEDGVCAKCSRTFGDTEVQPLYRVDGGAPTCSTHIAAALDVAPDNVEELGRARRIMAARTAPELPTSTEPVVITAPETTEAMPATEPREVERGTVEPGNLITVVVSGRSIERSTPWEQAIPETISVTGTVFPGYRSYHQSTDLLDAVIRDADGNELAVGEDVFVRQMPAQVHLTPAGHRDDLRPETRTVAQIRLGDLIAEGGRRGEVVTELRYAHKASRGFTGFQTRDVTSGNANGFILPNADEVLVVPRERRPAEDVATVFGRHLNRAQAAAETRRVHELHTALDEAASRQWPDAGGPQSELQTLRDAIQMIDADGSGSAVYRSNAAAMDTAAAAATALFESAGDTALYGGYLGEPLHQLRQHLDVQIHRLREDAARLTRDPEERVHKQATRLSATTQSEQMVLAFEDTGQDQRQVDPAPGPKGGPEGTARRTSTSLGADGTEHVRDALGFLPGEQPLPDASPAPDPQLGAGDQAGEPAAGPQRNAAASSVLPHGAAASRSVPSWEELLPYGEGEHQILGAEGERLLFGSRERMLELAAEGFIPTPVLKMESSGQVWRKGHFIGTVSLAPKRYGDHDKPEQWSTHRPFSVDPITFASREAAIAYLVLCDPVNGAPDLNQVDPDLARDLQGLANNLDLPSAMEGLKALEGDQNALERFEALRGLLHTLASGVTPSGNTADDIAQVHDELVWLTTRYKDPKVKLGQRHALGPRWLAQMMSEYLDTLRPTDQRAAHHQARLDRAAVQIQDELLADGGLARAKRVPPGNIHRGDLVRIEGRVTGLYSGATDRRTGYVISEPRKTTFTTHGRKEKGWRITVGTAPWSDNGTTFLLLPNKGGLLLARAADIDFPFGQHIYGLGAGEVFHGALEPANHVPHRVEPDPPQQRGLFDLTVETALGFEDAHGAEAGADGAEHMRAGPRTMDQEVSPDTRSQDEQVQASGAKGASEMAEPAAQTVPTDAAPEPAEPRAPIGAPRYSDGRLGLARTAQAAEAHDLETNVSVAQDEPQTAQADSAAAMAAAHSQNQLTDPSAPTDPSEETLSSEQQALRPVASPRVRPVDQTLTTDSDYRLHLQRGGGHPSAGELRHDGATVATLHLSAGGQWFARLAVDGVPADITAMTGTPQEAAHHGAILFSAITGASYGDAPATSRAEQAASDVDVLRDEAQRTAERHQDEISAAAARIWPSSYEKNPHIQELTKRLGALGQDRLATAGSRQLAAQLQTVHDAATAWRAALPPSTNTDERRFLAFPLAHLAYDVTRLLTRLEVTVDAVPDEGADHQQEAAADRVEQAGLASAVEAAPANSPAEVRPEEEPDYELLYPEAFDEPLNPEPQGQEPEVPEESAVLTDPVEVDDSTLAAGQESAAPSREGTTMAEEQPQESALPPIPEAPVLALIEHAGTEAAADLNRAPATEPNQEAAMATPAPAPSAVLPGPHEGWIVRASRIYFVETPSTQLQARAARAAEFAREQPDLAADAVVEQSDTAGEDQLLAWELANPVAQFDANLRTALAELDEGSSRVGERRELISEAAQSLRGRLEEIARTVQDDYGRRAASDDVAVREQLARELQASPLAHPVRRAITEAVVETIGAAMEQARQSRMEVQAVRTALEQAAGWNGAFTEPGPEGTVAPVFVAALTAETAAAQVALRTLEGQGEQQAADQPILDAEAGLPQSESAAEAPVLPEIDDADVELAAVRADSRADALRALWRVGPAALGVPEAVHDAVRMSWRQVGEQAAAEASRYRAQYAAEVGAILNDLMDEGELGAELSGKKVSPEELQAADGRETPESSPAEQDISEPEQIPEVEAPTEAESAALEETEEAPAVSESVAEQAEGEAEQESPDPREDAGGAQESGGAAEQSAAAPAEQGQDDPAMVTFAQIMAALESLRESAAVERAAAAGPQEPLAALSQGVAQLGTVVDPPNAPQPTVDLGLTGFEEVKQAYAAAAQHGREYNGAREWRQLTELWQSSQQVWENARDVLRRSGARVADRVRGICRAVGARVADGVARLSDRLAQRLAKAGREGSPGHRALRSLSEAAERGAHRLRDRSENFVVFGQITDSLRDLRTDLARGTDMDGERQDAPAGDRAPAARDREVDAFQLVNEAFGNASRHGREYNGAPEWRRLNAVLPVANRVFGEQRTAVLARYGADLVTDIRWQGALRTAGVRSLDTVALLSHKLAERLAKAGRYDSPGRRAVQDLGHTAQRAASAVRGDEAVERVAAFDRLSEAIRDLKADLDQVLDDGPGHGAGAAVPFGEPSRPVLAAREGKQKTARPDDHNERPAQPALSGGRGTGSGVGE
ncbi:SNF2-related protein [Streptomyces sp. NPDC049577]|uniref:SNF2-related protein n=1 Tax=Streptomyces sp. NPDC049577 TaxID=3155153 RepID=UPI003427EBBC